jgi:protein-disulfide isomerase
MVGTVGARPIQTGMSMRIPLGLVIGVFAAVCSTSVDAQSAAKQTSADVVATVGPARITLAQVDELALHQTADRFGNLKLLQAIYAARRQAIDELVANMLLDEDARAQHVERATLLERQVSSKAAAPTDAEVTTWYLANQERVQGATLEQARGAIRAFILQERTEAARLAYVERLKAKTPVKVVLEQPREAVKGAGAALGPANAPIELVEFSDFECPYCRRAAPSVKQIVEAYGDRVRLVYRHYPLPQHPNARPAAEASLCANEQGKFWAYHDRLFADPAKITEAGLKQTAKDVGLDAGRFDTCVDSHRFRDAVDADLKAGLAAGVSGTPAFFINGRPLLGDPSFDGFKRIIDEELALKTVR